MINRFQSILEENKDVIADIKKIIVKTLKREQRHFISFYSGSYSDKIRGASNVIRSLEEIQKSILIPIKNKYEVDSVQVDFDISGSIKSDINFKLDDCVFCFRYLLTGQVELCSLVLKSIPDVFSICYSSDNITFVYPEINSINYSLSHNMYCLEYSNGSLSHSRYTSDIEPPILNLIVTEDLKKDIVAFQQFFYKSVGFFAEHKSEINSRVVDNFFSEKLYKEKINNSELDDFKDLFFLLDDSFNNSINLPFKFDANQKIKISKQKNPELSFSERIKLSIKKTINTRAKKI